MSEREWRLYLNDMIGFSEKVIAYTKGLDQQAFVASDVTYDATLRNPGWMNDIASRVHAAVDIFPALVYKYAPHP